MQIQPQHWQKRWGTSMTGKRKLQTESIRQPHGQAVHWCFDQKTQHITKPAHDILPPNHRIHKYDKTHSAKCPLYDHLDEDRGHFLRCPDAVWRRWRVELLNAIHMKCHNLRMHPIPTEILLERISEWLSGGTLSPSRYDLRYHQLIQEQNDISWRHIFNDRLTPLKWSELQADHLFVINNTEKHLSGRLWTSAIIKEVWSHWQLVLWTQHNNTIHGLDETSRNAAHRCRAKIMLHEMYSRKDLMKPSDRDKISMISSTTLQKPPTKLWNGSVCTITPPHQSQYPRNWQTKNMRSRFHSGLLPSSSTVLTRSTCKCIISLTHFCGPGAWIELFSLWWTLRPFSSNY